MVEDALPQAVAAQGNISSRLAMLAEVASAMADVADYDNTHSLQHPKQPTSPRSLRKGCESSLAAGPTPLPPTPPTPYPWTWRCHECDSEYPLAVTQRCLYCSHHFCTTPQTDTRLKRVVPGERDCCDAEFDYYGWAQWGAYRRSVGTIRAREMARSGIIAAVNPSNGDTKGPVKRKRGCDIGDRGHDAFAMFGLTTVPYKQTEYDTGRLVWKPLLRPAGKEVLRRKKKLYVSGQYNCWLHCDFPTECVGNIYNTWTEGRACLSGEHDSPVSQSHEEQGCSGNEKNQESQTLGEREEKKKKRKKDTAHPEYSQGLRSSRLWGTGDKISS